MKAINKAVGSRALEASQAIEDEGVIVMRTSESDDGMSSRDLVPTCFGRSIDELIRIPDGSIQKLVADKYIKGYMSYVFEVQYSVSRLFFELTDMIQLSTERCIADEAMLKGMDLPQKAGWPFDPATQTAEPAQQDSIKADLVSALDGDVPLSEALPVKLSFVNKLEAL
ncbi:hypothetical protein E4U59_003251 [Claviceps monticola]|nr:hypothetical protein E4U59_003251 [Claviceps monticola]